MPHEEKRNNINGSAFSSICRMAIAVKSADSSTKMDKKNLTVVTAPDQKEAQENEQFTVPEYKSAEVKGENVALKGKASANGYTDVYTPVYANDGDRDTTSYWEGAGKGDDEITIDLKKVYNVHTVRLAVNPATIWGARKQTLSIMRKWKMEKTIKK